MKIVKKVVRSLVLTAIALVAIYNSQSPESSQDITQVQISSISTPSSTVVIDSTN